MSDNISTKICFVELCRLEDDEQYGRYAENIVPRRSERLRKITQQRRMSMEVNKTQPPLMKAGRRGRAKSVFSDSRIVSPIQRDLFGNATPNIAGSSLVRRSNDGHSTPLNSGNVPSVQRRLFGNPVSGRNIDGFESASDSFGQANQELALDLTQKKEQPLLQELIDANPANESGPYDIAYNIDVSTSQVTGHNVLGSNFVEPVGRNASETEAYERQIKNL